MDLKQHSIINDSVVSDYVNPFILKTKQISSHNVREICRFCLDGNAKNNIFQVRFEKTIIFNFCKEVLPMVNI